MRRADDILDLAETRYRNGGGKNPQTDQKEMFLFAFKAVHADQTKPVREA